NGIGLAHKTLGDVNKALEYYERSSKLSLEIGDKQGQAKTLVLIAGLYRDKKDYAAAQTSYEKALAMIENTGNNSTIANIYNNIGILFSDQNNYVKALEYYLKSQVCYEKTGDKSGISTCYVNLGRSYLKLGQRQKAIDFGNKAFKLTEELNYPKNIKESADLMRMIYRETGDVKNELKMFTLYIQMRDTLTSIENKKASFKQQLSYDYEKKVAADSIKAMEEKKIIDAEVSAKNAQLKQEKTQRFALYGGLALVFVFAVFMFNRFRITQKQKSIIEKQKHEVELQKLVVDEKNKEITDSINYAKRLQDAILPPQHLIDSFFPQNFVLFKPKDIVAGDFFWMETMNDVVLIAAADSTGHGVPGAMVSVVCSNALNRAVKEFGITVPGKILDKTRELVLETFSKSTSEVKDGMDISLAAIKRINNAITLSWAGANNALLYIEKGILIELKADKQPIGKTENPIPFTTHTLEVSPGTSIYLFTDGYADQFGGPKGKKLKQKQFKETILENKELAMAQQAELLADKFNNWKGKLEQVDDVTVIGIQL
ncbi:MAG: tetratricopeptide repeat protein, partial [Bacteroidia bacterium]|nr:tetratricopeptide repeat protein [Bacteroidia bacterium]